MRYRNINYYGYEKGRYTDCIELIHDTNYKHMLILNTWFFVLTVVFMVLSRLNQFGVNKRNFNLYFISMLASLAFEIILIFFKQFSEKYAQILTYINIIILLAFSVFISIAQPYLAATMYLVLVVLVAVTYIDTMVRMTIVLILYSSFFLFSSYEKKPVSIAQLDVYNITVFLVLALILHFTFQRAKMHEFYTLRKNIQIQRDLVIRSSFDTLTDLLNRARFFAIAGEIIKDYTEKDGYMAVVLLDLDSFKQINDKLGHQMGDKAIQITGSILVDCLNIDMLEKWSFTERAVTEKLCFAGRLGGDEFICLIRGKGAEEEVAGILENILKKLNAVRIGELNGIHASFGVTAINPEDTDIDTAYNRADDALYESKRAGKNQISFK